MSLFSSLEARDRRWLFWSAGLAVLVAVLFSVFSPADDDSNTTPSSYLTGKHDARAAFDTLVNAGYPIERWEGPLDDLAAQAGPATVVIFAEPQRVTADQIAAVQKIVDRGGRVLSTGSGGGYLVPGGAPAESQKFAIAACQLQPEGLDPLASSGEVWMVPQSGWTLDQPRFRVQYACSGQPAVVEYSYGKGRVVWWASASPLENESIARAANLDLLLNSIGPPQGHRFFWDESLHGLAPSTWSYASGPALTLLRVGLLVFFVLVVFSFSRRSGPVRDLPPPARAMPIEYLQALGALYQNAGSASTAVAVALDRFRRQSLRLCGLPPGPMPAAELAAALLRRFPAAGAQLESDLLAAESAQQDDALQPRAALALVQALQAHQQSLAAAAHAGRSTDFTAKERAS